MATKVGEGYIEIKPRLVGFNQSLVTDARAKLKSLESANFTVKPKIQGITKEWQAEVQAELKAKITGLTVPVKVVLDNDLKATFGEVTIAAKAAGDDAGREAGKGFNSFLSDLRRDMDEAKAQIKTGLKSPDDPDVHNALKNVGGAFKDLTSDIDHYSNSQVASIRRGIDAHTNLGATVVRESKKQSEAMKATTADLETEIRNTIRETDRMVEGVKNSLSTANLHKKGTGIVSSLLGDVNTEGRKVLDDLENELSKGAEEAGSLFGGKFATALGTTLRFGLARVATTAASILTFGGYLLEPVMGAISQLAAGFTALASSGFYLVGSLAALPGLFAAIAQGAGVLGIAVMGIQGALNALQAQQQHSALTAQTMAKAQETAAKQVANAKQALADAVRSSNRQIEDAESSLAKAQEDASKRIKDAIQRLADAKEQANDRIAQAQDRLNSALADTGIADAQDRLRQAVEDVADKIASAQQRVADATSSAADQIVSAEDRLQKAHDKTTSAQERLNEARKTAAKRIEDLRIQEQGGLVDEAAAQLAIKEAQAKIDATFLDPHHNQLDVDAAQQAYDEAVQRLKEIQAKNKDIADQVQEADRTGVEGSKEVTDAKQAVVDAQNDQIAAEKELQKTRESAARDISDAEKDLAKARKDGAKQVSDAEQAISDARAKQAKDIASAEKDLADARKQSARDIADAEAGIADARKTANENVKSAEQNLAQAREDAARNIARAQDNLKESLAGVAEAMSKVNAQSENVDFAMSLLSPRAQEFVRYLNDTFIPKLKNVQFAIQDAFYPPIKEALEKSDGLLGLFQGKLTTTADIFGTFAGRVIDWLNTDETKNTLGHIMDSNNRIFTLLGDAAFHFGSALLGLADAAGPFLERMARFIDKFATWIDKIVNSKEGRAELKDFFDRVGDTIETVLEILGRFGTAFYNIFKLGQPEGQKLLDLILETADKFARWVTSTEGKNQLKEWFEKGKDVMIELGGLIDKIIRAFFTMSKDIDFAAVIKSVNDDLLPAIKQFADSMSGDNGQGIILLIKTTATALLEMSDAITLVKLAWDTLFGSGEDIMADLATLGESAKVTARIWGTDVPDSSETAVNSFRKIGKTAAETAGDTANSFKKIGEGAKGSASDVGGASDKVGKSTGDMKDKVSGHVSDMNKDVKDKTQDMANSMKSKTEDGTKGATKSTEDMKNEIASKLYGMQLDSASKFRSMQNSAVGATGDMKNGVDGKMVDTRNMFSSRWDEIERALRDRRGSMTSAGQWIMDGLIAGVGSLSAKVLDFFTNLGNNILNAFRRAMGISSPSQKMIQAGKYIGEGLALGITSTSGLITDATKGMADSLTGTWEGLSPTLNVKAGVTGPKMLPTPNLGSTGATGPQGQQGNVTNYNLSLTAVPTVPTERQVLNALAYADALYGN